VSDHWQKELTKAFADLTTRIEKLAQDQAGTEAVLLRRGDPTSGSSTLGSSTS
jgi:hypothetical protein